MPKFRKKPVVIEARQWDGFCTTAERLMQWMRTHGVSSVYTDGPSALTICTLEGDMIAVPGDWIIQGVKGEFYPCKPDIFEATYEEVNDGARASV